MRPQLSPLTSALLLAGIGAFVALVWNESTIRLFLFGPHLISWGISAKTLVISMQIGAAFFTLIGGGLSAYFAFRISGWLGLQLSKNTRITLFASLLWGITFYAGELSEVPKYIADNPGALILSLYAGRIFIDLLSILLFWWTLRWTYR